MKTILTLALGFSLQVMAQTSTQTSKPQTTIPSSGGTQTTAVSIKDAKESCKKDGKEGKALVECIKEKVK